MSLRLVVSSAVVTAQHFNPSVMGQHWLIENKIVMQEEFKVGSVFTDMFAQIPTPDFQLQVIQENCQLTFPPSVTLENQEGLLKNRLATMIELLPHTPYTAVGFNFVWQMFPDFETPADTCRRLFFLKDKPLYGQFDKGDARFGAYMSMSWGAFRLRLEAKPIIQLTPPEQNNEMVQFAFNYHLGVAGKPEPWRVIIGTFDQWQSAYDMSRSILVNATGETSK